MKFEMILLSEHDPRDYLRTRLELSSGLESESNQNILGCAVRGKRRGIAAVEFAVMLPLVVLLLLGAVEVGRGVMVSHSLQEAAQAGCRVYSVAGITNQTITFEPPSKGQIDVHMEPVTVTVTIPFVNVAWVSPNFLNGAALQGKCIMPADLDVSDGGDMNGYTLTDDDNVADGFERDDDDNGDDDDDDDDDD